MIKFYVFMLMICLPVLGRGQAVVINEVAWMGTAASATDEWIELMNTQDLAQDLTGWRVETADGSPGILLSGTISGHGFLLLERTDDMTIADIPADQIYTGDLKNSGEWLLLFDADSSLIDAVKCDSLGWYAGSNAPKRSMERRNPLLPGSDPANWADHDSLLRNGVDAKGNPVYGTPRQLNSVFDLSLSAQSVSSPALPHKFCSIFPNPSTGIMIFAWSPGPGAVSVQIVDVLGRQVRSWPCWPRGSGRLLWDGRNEQGMPVSSGIYLGRIVQSGKVLGQMRLLRQR